MCVCMWMCICACVCVYQDDYSRYGIQAFSKQLEEQGGCPAFHLSLPSSPSPAQLGALADALVSSTARVVVVFATEGQLLGLLSEVGHHPFLCLSLFLCFSLSFSVSLFLWFSLSFSGSLSPSLVLSLLL